MTQAKTKRQHLMLWLALTTLFASAFIAGSWLGNQAAERLWNTTADGCIKEIEK